MAIIKCKMCGGDLNITEGMTVAECEYCGSKQTIPSQDSEKKLTLFARANRLRRSCEFYKAAGVYESIVADFPEEAEAYWGLVLCRYGIEYVDDPGTGKKIPTCHRSSFDSILEDTDFEQACENADAVARRIYRDEAKVIEDIRRNILEVSSKEMPYDIFICYKETDEKGERTIDSVIAQDVYTVLTEKGYRVFFSRISLEDKLGTEYEPYIFAALNSAKIMLVFGTDFEYFNAVWVKNEWSRFLALITAGQKKTLIPCYKDVDAYDMPKEFQRLQAQDMGKVGAIQDLVRGVEKILSGTQATPAKETVVVSSGGSDVSALMMRGNLSLEDEDWDKAEKLFDQILSIEPMCGEAYLGMAMAKLRLRNREAFRSIYVNTETIHENKQVIRAKQFMGGELKAFFDRMDAEKKQHAEKITAQTAEWHRRQKEHFGSITPDQLIAGGGIHTAVRLPDGRVAATQCLISGYDSGQSCVDCWNGIVAIAAGIFHTIGLQADGTVISTTYTGSAQGNHGQCNVSNWRDIVSITCGFYCTIGVKKNGSVVAVGDNQFGQCNVGSWGGIVAVATKDHYTIGLHTDGTVVVTGKNENVCFEAATWTDITAVAAGVDFIVGVHKDGTLVTAGEDDYSSTARREIESWQGIIAISIGINHTVGLRADGTVVAIQNAKISRDGKYSLNQQDFDACDVQNWTDIIAVSAGNLHTIGLKKDGTLVAAGYNGYGACNVYNWRLFNHVETVNQEIETVNQEFIRQTKLNAIHQEYHTLETELSGLGFFNSQRKREIKARMKQLMLEEIQLSADN